MIIMNKHFSKALTGTIFFLLMMHCANQDAGFSRNNPMDSRSDRWSPPAVTALDSAIVNINDSLTITAIGTDNGTIVKYLWAVNSTEYTYSTDSAKIQVAFSTEGKKVIRVKAVDDNGIVSQPDSCLLTVTLDPPTAAIKDSASVDINDTISFTAAANDNGTIINYVWMINKLDSGVTTTDSIYRTSFSDTGRNVLYVKVIDDDSLFSRPESCVVIVTCERPEVAPMDDAEVSIEDSITITAHGTDNGEVSKFVWAVNDTIYSDTTDSGSLSIAFADSGRYVIWVKVIDDDGLVSEPDSCVVTVSVQAPVVTAQADTGADINDTIVINAFADDDGTVEKYLWALNGSDYTDTTDTGAIKAAFVDSGRYVVRIKALDDHGLASEPDSCIVTVTSGTPWVEISADASVNLNETFTVTAAGHDNRGTIAKYIWAINDQNYTDSTDDGTFTVECSDSGRMVVRVRVLDNDGNLSSPDSCVIIVTYGVPEVVMMENAGVNINDSITIKATGTDSGGSIVEYIWATDGINYIDTTEFDTLVVAFSDSGRVIVRVRVIDNDGIVSRADSCVITVTWDPPTVTVPAVESVNMNDSITIRATAEDNAPVNIFIWSRDGIVYTDTTGSDSMRIAYADTGRQVVGVKVIDNDGLVSPPDLCVITVTAGVPEVTIMDDREIYTGDSLVVTAEGVDNDGQVVKFLWAKNDTNFKDNTNENSISVAFNQSGRAVVRVRAVDDDGLVSKPDSCVITVISGIPWVKAAADTQANIKDSIPITAESGDNNGEIEQYRWALDGFTYEKTTETGFLRVAFSDSGRHVVRVIAVDNDGNESAPDSCVVKVWYGQPRVSALSDQVGYINEEIIVTAAGSDSGGEIVSYLWAIDCTDYLQTTEIGELKVSFPDNGRHVVRVKAVDDDGLESPADSCVITISNGTPTVQVMSDTAVDIYDSLVLTAEGSDNGEIIKYLWAKNGTDYRDTTDSGRFKTAFADTGRHLVRVKVIDNQDLESQPGACIVTVSAGVPVLTPRPDTIVSFTAASSISVTVSAEDTNSSGSIEKYYWGTGAEGWDDSTDESSFTLVPADVPRAGEAFEVRWAVRDDDNLFAYDTFTVQITNSPPSSVSLQVPTRDDWVVLDYTRLVRLRGHGDLLIKMSASDPDGPSDSLDYALYTGPPGADELNLIYSGTDNEFIYSRYRARSVIEYRLVVKDLHEEGTFVEGTMNIPPPPIPSLPEMKFIEGGIFFMGDSTSDSTNDKPVHEVTVSDFWMDSTEVTQKQFNELMHAMYKGFDDEIPLSQDRDNPYCAAHNIGWGHAVLYCNARTLASGSTDTVYSYDSRILGTNHCELAGVSINYSANGYRLPTEAEWEYACRGGTNTIYYWGNESDEETVDQYAWYLKNASNFQTVAQKLPNSYGLYDMIGNVLEWCNDWYDSTYYTGSPTINPTGPSSGSSRVLRGGLIFADEPLLRSGHREAMPPYFNPYDYYIFFGRGFRVVLPAQ